MSKAAPEQSGTDRVVVLVKAAPQPSTKYQETVCAAGITYDRQWIRLFPITFRTLEEAQKFRRWDVVEYTWRKPKDDQRIESHRANQRSLSVVGKVEQKQRFGLVDPLVVDNLKAEREAGRSLALVRPKNMRFSVKKRTAEELAEAQEEFARVTRQGNLFEKALRPHQPCPYSFHYEYDIADGRRHGTCQDWEIEATFFNWRKEYGEDSTIKRMIQRWGEEFPRKDIVFAMGTHSRWPDTWLINGVIQLPDAQQTALF